MNKSLSAVFKENVESWLFVVLTGASLFYVLFVFKGFEIYQGISDSGHSLFWRSLLYAFFTSLIFYLFEFPIYRFLPKKLPQKKLIVRSAALIVGLNTTFLLLNYFWNWQDLERSVYYEILIEYPLIMVIPVVAISIVKILKPKNLKTEDKMILFKADNGKDQICVVEKDLLYLKSAGNYTEINVNAGGKTNAHLLRRSLSSIEDEFASQNLFQRCHRSYLVNRSAKKSILKKGGKTELNLGSTTIPVSKSFQATFNEM